jgi:hypothetical protein
MVQRALRSARESRTLKTKTGGQISAGVQVKTATILSKKFRSSKAAASRMKISMIAEVFDFFLAPVWDVW